MRLTIEYEREEAEGTSPARWIAEVLEVRGAIVYASTREDARDAVVTLAYQILLDQVEHAERAPDTMLSIEFLDAAA
jgi:hypothetical protein